MIAPLNPGEYPKLPGEEWRHPTESDLFIMGDIGGPKAVEKYMKGSATAARPTQVSAPLFRGNYGFIPPPQPTASVAPVEK